MARILQAKSKNQRKIKHKYTFFFLFPFFFFFIPFIIFFLGTPLVQAFRLSQGASKGIEERERERPELKQYTTYYREHKIETTNVQFIHPRNNGMLPSCSTNTDHQKTGNLAAQ